MSFAEGFASRFPSLIGGRGPERRTRGRDDADRQAVAPANSGCLGESNRCGNLSRQAVNPTGAPIKTVFTGGPFGFGKILTKTVVLLSLATLVGCGFQLRGWELESSVESIHLDAQPRIRFAQPLRQALRQSGVRIEPRGAEAELVLKLLDERRQRRTVAVTGSARAAEYEITLGVRYEIRAGGNVLREPRWLEASRVLVVDRDNIAGTAGEQALIEAELQNDLVQQILRALDAAARSSVSPGDPDTN